MRMQKLLGVFVLDREGIKVPNFYQSADFPACHGVDLQLALGVEQQFVSRQGLLERWTHECVPWSRKFEDLEVHPEERQVDHERERDKADCSVEEMAVKVCLARISW